MPLWLMGWLGPRAFKLAGAGVVALVGVSACMVRDVSIEKRGAAKTVAKIEKANTNASKAGKRAAERSTAAGVRGERDPTTRDD